MTKMMTAPRRVRCAVATRRFEIMDKLEDERDLLCLGRPGLLEIGRAWAVAGVGITVARPRVSDVAVTRRGLLGLRCG